MANHESAFPVNAANLGGSGAYPPEPGMTLRDYFAAQAMVAAYPLWHECDTRKEVLAKSCYEMAEAMLTERSRTQSGDTQ